MTESHQDRQRRCLLINLAICTVLRLRKKVAIQVARTGVHPNVISLLGIIICLTSGLMIATGAPLVFSVLVFLLGSLMDSLDGPIAEASQRKRRNKQLGGFIDAMSDKMGEIAFLAGLMFRSESIATLRLIGIASFLGLLSSYSKSASIEYQIDIRWSEVKVFGRALRVTIVVVGLLATGLFSHVSEKGVHTTMVILATFNSATLMARVLRVLVHTYATRNPSNTRM